jgi:hypothetical protein
MRSKASIAPALAAAGAWLAACGGGGGGGGSSGPGGGPGGGDPPVELAGPQVGTLQIDLASGAVLVTAQPQALVLGGSAVYDALAGSVVLSLSLLNHSTTVLASPKVLFTGLSEGTVAGDGTFGPAPALPYVYFGPESMLTEAAVARDVLIEGVSGASPTLEVAVDVRRHPWIFFASAWDDVSAADASGTGAALSIDVHAFGFKGEDAIFRPEASSSDGRYLRFACRNQPAVATLDLADLSFSLGSSLMGGVIAFDGSGAVGSTDGLTAAGDFLYAVVNVGAHSFRSAGDYPPPEVRLVKLDAEDLSVEGELSVFPSTEVAPVGGAQGDFVEYRGRKLSVSADGARGALAITDLGLVFLLDLAAMSVIDADPLAPGDQAFDLSPGSQRARFAALSPDGSAIYAVRQGGDGTLDVIDVATGAVTPLTPPSPVGPTYLGFLVFGPDGRLYYGRDLDFDATPGLAIYDPAALSWSVPEGIADASGIDFTAEAYCVHDSGSDELVCFGLADDAVLAVEATGAASIPAVGSDRGHGLAITRE